MEAPKIFDSEYRFALIVWELAPVTTHQLVEQCQERLGWKRTTTYTVLRRLCDRGVFHLADKMVSVLIPKEQVQLSQSEDFLTRTFQGSLPSFIAAFTRQGKLSEKDVRQIRQLIDEYEGKHHD